MIFTLMGRAFKALMKKPFRVFALAMFAALLSYLGMALFAGVPAVGLAIGMLLSASLAWMYLRTLRGDVLGPRDMLGIAKDGKTLKRVLIGMAWRELWIFIWGLIPGAGAVFAAIRTYEYRAVPYILLDEPEMDPMDALEASKKLTKGYRMKMFLADLLLVAAVFVTALVLYGFALIWMRVLGVMIFFALIASLTVYALVLIAALFSGMLQAVFYEEMLHPTPKPVREKPVQIEENMRFCARCGYRYKVGEAHFCPKCGNPLEAAPEPEANAESEPAPEAEEPQQAE